MMARSTKKSSSSRASGTRKAGTNAKKAHSKAHSNKKTVFQRLLTAEGWKRLMMGKSRKKSK